VKRLHENPVRSAGGPHPQRPVSGWRAGIFKHASCNQRAVGRDGPRSGAVLFPVALLYFGWVLPGQAASPILSTNQPPVVSLVPDASFSVIRVFGALALVLALFLVGVWVFKNWQRLALHRGRPSQLQLIEVKPLGGKHVLYVVGYQQQRLLLAASPTGVSLLSHLPAVVGGELEANAGAVPNNNFVQALQQAVQGKS